VLQEAFLRTYEAAAAGSIDSPRAYLFVTARNIVYKDMKRKARYVASAIDEIARVDPGASPDIAVHDRRKMAAFLEALNSLPDQCRRVFLLRKFYGYSHKRIARELGLSEKTVENHLVNGLKRCASWMRSKGYDDVPQSLARRNADEAKLKSHEDQS
jgi:RNA polymerase sigma-70 factor (ECF subfamily)